MKPIAGTGLWQDRRRFLDAVAREVPACVQDLAALLTPARADLLRVAERTAFEPAQRPPGCTTALPIDPSDHWVWWGPVPQEMRVLDGEVRAWAEAWNLAKRPPGRWALRGAWVLARAGCTLRQWVHDEQTWLAISAEHRELGLAPPEVPGRTYFAAPPWYGPAGLTGPLRKEEKEEAAAQDAQGLPYLRRWPRAQDYDARSKRAAKDPAHPNAVSEVEILQRIDDQELAALAVWQTTRGGGGATRARDRLQALRRPGQALALPPTATVAARYDVKRRRMSPGTVLRLMQRHAEWLDLPPRLRGRGGRPAAR